MKSEGKGVSALEQPKRDLHEVAAGPEQPQAGRSEELDPRPFPRLLQIHDDDDCSASCQREPSLSTDRSTAAGSSVPAADFLAGLSAVSNQLESADPQSILAWAIERYGEKFAFATAFGPEGMLLIHFIAGLRANVRIFNLDTGYQFPETLKLRDQVFDRYGIEVEMLRPETTVQEYETLHGGPLYQRDSKQCCHDRKIVVLRKALRGVEAWASAIRRDQSPDRAQAPIVGWDAKFSLVKVSPLANWTRNDVWRMIVAERIPYNPLHDQGFVSIGCWPCTRAVRLGEDERAGRWSGQERTECGLHSVDD